QSFGELVRRSRAESAPVRLSFDMDQPRTDDQDQHTRREAGECSRHGVDPDGTRVTVSDPTSTYLAQSGDPRALLLAGASRCGTARAAGWRTAVAVCSVARTAWHRPFAPRGYRPGRT